MPGFAYTDLSPEKSRLSAPKKVLILRGNQPRSILAGIDAFASQSGWVLQWADSRQASSILPCDGIIAEHQHLIDNRPLAFKGAHDTPVVSVGALENSMYDGEEESSPLRYSAVSVDYRSAGRLAATSFIKSGHTEFLYVSETPPDQASWQGFQSTLTREGQRARLIRLDRTKHTSQKNERTLGPEALIKTLRAASMPLAVFTATDLTALAVLDLCERAGLNVPAQVSIIGCGNDDMMCRHARIPLSSVDLNEQQAGYASAEMLERMMNDPHMRNRRVNITAKGIITRQSSSDLAVGHLPTARALVYIRKHFNQPTCNVGAVASASGLSKPGLNHSFDQFVGHPVSKEIQRRRLEMAITLLRTTNQKIKEIATHCGFRSEKHFRDTFIRNQGLAPSQFRDALNAATMQSRRRS
jgi:LacI family transcriptional regulator